MQAIVILLTISTLLLIISGLYFWFYPEKIEPRFIRNMKGTIGVNLMLFVAGISTILIFSVEDVLAAAEATQPMLEVSVGLGLALIGIGLPTGLATIGAGIAVNSVGAASLAVIAEKPEMFGRTLIYLGLAEGIAIYGLVVTILMLGKI